MTRAAAGRDGTHPDLGTDPLKDLEHWVLLRTGEQSAHHRFDPLTCRPHKVVDSWMASMVRGRTRAFVDLVCEGRPHLSVGDAASLEDVARPSQVEKIGFSGAEVAFHLFALSVGQGPGARFACHYR